MDSLTHQLHSVFQTHLFVFGVGGMAAGTSNDYTLLKSPECTRDERLLVKWERLKSSGAFLSLFVIVCWFLLFLSEMV